jgi:hypothetical protein
MSRADDGARQQTGEPDTGITTHGVTRAAMLRPGQRVLFDTAWVEITAVEYYEDRTRAHLGDYWPISYNNEDIVQVRDILHTYTESIEQ